ncbi:MAG: glycosyltransferase family 2 protein [Bacteroidota bacterium]|nr:glycosyltransferase family 2 protein [Bacteroidota bacterium]
MVKSKKNFLTVVIITNNEARNVERCLKSASTVADEIIVLDSFSTDETPLICQKYGVKFIQKEWAGFAKTKNMANEFASTDWILSLDADEELSPELQQEILDIKKSDHQYFYTFSRLTNYCGKWVQHCGWTPDVKLRLFDRTRARWTGEYVHETLETDPGITTLPLRNICRHYSYHSLEDHARRVNRYSTLAAEERVNRGIKPSYLKLLFGPGVKFWNTYLLKKGFLDGKEGLFISIISAYGIFLREAKMWYFKRLQKEKS